MLKKVVMVHLAKWAKGVKGVKGAKGVKGMQDNDGGVDDDARGASGEGGKGW